MAPELRLGAIRKLMEKYGFDCYFVRHTDNHESEYLATCYERCAFISGFTGTNAFGLITQDKALMYTDGRYYLQANKQLLEGWQLEKLEPKVPSPTDWIKENLKAGATIGADASQMSVTYYEGKEKFFKENGFVLKCPNENLVDLVWNENNGAPKMPLNEVWILD